MQITLTNDKKSRLLYIIVLFRSSHYGLNIIRLNFFFDDFKRFFRLGESLVIRTAGDSSKITQSFGTQKLSIS